MGYKNAITAKQNRIVSLDIFRGIAMLLVALYHFTSRLPSYSLNMETPVNIQINFGWIGVYFFFIISGYCIFMTLERAKDIRTFLAKRFSRVYPAFLAATILLFIFGLFAPVPIVPEVSYNESAKTIFDVFLNLIFLGELGEWINGSFWSIAVEIKFYLALAAFAFLFGSHKRLVFWFSILSLVMMLIWVFATIPLPFSDSIDSRSLLQFLVIAPYLCFFAFGILARRLKLGLINERWLFLTTGVAMVIVMSTLSYNPASDILEYIITITIFLILLYLFVRFALGAALPNIPILTPLLAKMGLLSYSWYLLHETIGLTIMAIAGPYIFAWANVLLALTITFLLAWIFSSIFEWRFRKIFENLALWIMNIFDFNKNKKSTKTYKI